MLNREFLTPQQLSDRYHNQITVGTLSIWRYYGKGPAYIKLGRNVIYPLDKVVEWEEANTRTHTKASRFG